MGSLVGSGDRCRCRAHPGRLAFTSPHIGLKRLQGRGRPRGGPGGAHWFPGALRQESGRSGRGLPAHCRPSSCPPSARGAPQRWSGRSSLLREPLGTAVPRSEYGGGGALVGSGAQGPSRPLLSSSSLAAGGAGLPFPEMSLCLVSLPSLWLLSLRPPRTLRSPPRLF